MANEARDAHNERMRHQWRWVRYKVDNRIKASTPMYYNTGVPSHIEKPEPTPEYVVFCALERMKR